MAVEKSDDVHILDVPVQDVWAGLKADQIAQMVDVRTMAEWAFVGLPDLSSLGRRVLTQEWQTFPENRVDPDFGKKLGAALDAAGVTNNDEILFHLPVRWSQQDGG